MTNRTSKEGGMQTETITTQGSELAGVDNSIAKLEAEVSALEAEYNDAGNLEHDLVAGHKRAWTEDEIPAARRNLSEVRSKLAQAREELQAKIARASEVPRTDPAAQTR